jgi:hypothetical protein
VPQQPTITWDPYPQFSSATRAEHAFIGALELVAFDLSPVDNTPRRIGFTIFGGERFTTMLKRGETASFTKAKTAAVTAAAALIADH